jgi:hypothetical protein
MTDLASQRRGDPFEYSSALTGSWIESMFAGGFKFTLRRFIPDSSVVTDQDSEGYIDQGTNAEITFQDPTHFTVAFPSSRTTAWPIGKWFWDFVGTVDEDHSYTIDSGTVLITGDVTRTP